MGLLVPTVTRYYFLSLPVAIPAIFLGRFVNQRMRGETFVKYVYIGLVGVGLLLLLQAAYWHVDGPMQGFKEAHRSLVRSVITRHTLP